MNAEQLTVQMAKNGSEYSNQCSSVKYYFNANGEMYKVEDELREISLKFQSKQNNKRTVTPDSTGRKYIITYSSDTEHPRVIQIDDVTGDRTVRIQLQF